MSPEVAQVVHRTSALAAGIAVVTSPVPLLDELLLMPVYGGLIFRIGSLRGLGVRAIPWRAMGQTTLIGLGVRATMNLAFAAIPGVAAAANAISAVAFTELLGRHVSDSCADPANARPLGAREMAAMLRKLVTEQTGRV